jgi:hypothetical protein
MNILQEENSNKINRPILFLIRCLVVSKLEVRRSKLFNLSCSRHLGELLKPRPRLLAKNQGSEEHHLLANSLVLLSALNLLLLCLGVSKQVNSGLPSRVSANLNNHLLDRSLFLAAELRNQLEVSLVEIRAELSLHLGQLRTQDSSRFKQAQDSEQDNNKLLCLEGLSSSRLLQCLVERKLNRCLGQCRWDNSNKLSSQVYLDRIKHQDSVVLLLQEDHCLVDQMEGWHWVPLDNKLDRQQM